MPGERNLELLQVRRCEGGDLLLAQAQFGSMAAQWQLSLGYHLHTAMEHFPRVLNSGVKALFSVPVQFVIPQPQQKSFPFSA